MKFTVLGTPKPQGSKHMVRTKSGRTLMLESCKDLRPWRDSVSSAAMDARTGPLEAGPVQLCAEFYFVRPKSHYKGGRPERGLSKSAPSIHAHKPDLSKLVRAVEDSLSGVILRDDCQIASIVAAKQYGEPARCEISVQRL